MAGNKGETGDVVKSKGSRAGKWRGNRGKIAASFEDYLVP